MFIFYFIDRAIIESTKVRQDQLKHPTLEKHPTTKTVAHHIIDHQGVIKIIHHHERQILIDPKKNLAPLIGVKVAAVVKDLIKEAAIVKKTIDIDQTVKNRHQKKMMITPFIDQNQPIVNDPDRKIQMMALRIHPVAAVTQSLKVARTIPHRRLKKVKMGMGMKQMFQ